MDLDNLANTLIPNQIIKSFLTTIEENGVPRKVVVEHFGFEEEFLDANSYDVSFQTYLEMIDYVRGIKEIPALGLKNGFHSPVEKIGILGYAFISSRNLRAALSAYGPVLPLGGMTATISLHEEGELAHLSAQWCQMPSAYHTRYFIDDWISSCVTSFRNLISGSFEVLQVRFPYPEPDCAQVYHELLDCPLSFDEEVLSVTFPRAALDTPFELANEAINQVCRQQCRELMNQFQTASKVSDMVRQAIIFSPGQSDYSIDSIAAKLGMSVRTLQRSVKQEGQTFQEILTEVRMTTAAKYLTTTNLPVKNIAYLVGYLELPSFYRAFKKWSGASPVKYRNVNRKR